MQARQDKTCALLCDKGLCAGMGGAWTGMDVNRESSLSFLVNITGINKNMRRIQPDAPDNNNNNNSIIIIIIIISIIINNGRNSDHPRGTLMEPTRSGWYVLISIAYIQQMQQMEMGCCNGGGLKGISLECSSSVRAVPIHGRCGISLSPTS